MRLCLLSLTCSSLPPRDTPITFGKHKGKPLGTLPSKYLKWVSTTLRTRDTLHWAEMADKVLKDPIYQDRIEWEHAQEILTGNNTGKVGFKNAVDELGDVSERFGWDNEDKDAWRCVDFALLGTSHGGKIPRKKDGKGRRDEVEERESGGREKESSRMRRRERAKERRGSMGCAVEEKNSLGNTGGGDVEGKIGNSEDCIRFPGREGLLRKVLHNRGGRSL